MKPLFSKQEEGKRRSKFRFLCPWLDVWVSVWLSEQTEQTIFPDPVRPVPPQEAHLLIQGLWKWLEERGRCPENETRDVARGRWLDQAKTREWIMTKMTPAEAGGRGLGGNHCLSAFAMVVVRCPEAFTERQWAYSSVPLQCHRNLIPLPTPPSMRLLSCGSALQCTLRSHRRCEWEHGAGTGSSCPSRGTRRKACEAPLIMKGRAEKHNDFRLV